jgi:hypothetical protein
MPLLLNEYANGDDTVAVLVPVLVLLVSVTALIMATPARSPITNKSIRRGFDEDKINGERFMESFMNV